MTRELRLPQTTFDECTPGQYVLSRDLRAFYEVVRSGDVKPSQTISPDSHFMRCYWVDPSVATYHYKKGDLTISYFKTSFYGPFSKHLTDIFIDGLETKIRQNIN